MEKKMALNSIFNVVYKLLNVIFPLISVSFISHILLSDGVGKVSTAQNFVSYFTLIAAFGISSYGVRACARAKGEETNRVFSELFVINALSTIICSIAYYVIIFSLPIYKDKLLYAVCGINIVINIFNVDWFYQGKEEYVYITVRNFIFKLISLICLLAFIREKEDYIIYALISSLAICGNSIFNILHIRKFVSFHFKNITPSHHVKALLVLLFSTIATELYAKVDVTMIAAFCGDSQVGCYSNAVKLINIVVSVSTAITAVFLPRLGKTFFENKEQFNSLINLGLKIITFICIPGAIGIFVLAPSFVNILFGSSFVNSIETIRILSILIIVKSIGDLLCYQAVVGMNKEKFFLLFYSVAALINIILNALMIPSLEHHGAAIASVISELIVNIGIFIATKKEYEICNYTPFMCKVITSSIIMGISIILLDKIIANDLGIVVIGVSLGIFIYLVVNVVLKNKDVINSIIKIKKNIVKLIYK